MLRVELVGGREAYLNEDHIIRIAPHYETGKTEITLTDRSVLLAVGTAASLAFDVETGRK